MVEERVVVRVSWRVVEVMVMMRGVGEAAKETEAAARVRVRVVVLMVMTRVVEETAKETEGVGMVVARVVGRAGEKGHTST